MSNYEGAHWIRADLHLHSPAAYSFRYPHHLDPSQKDEVVRRYVQQLKDQNIQVAAITDYQQIRPEWFIPIRDAAREAGIYVYPGVELSFGGTTGGKRGLHILAVFPYDANIEQMNRAIDKILDGNSRESIIYENGHHRDFEPDKPLPHCLPEFRKETGALLIPAHLSDSKGLLDSFSFGEAADFISTIIPDAMENLDDKSRRKLIDTARISASELQKITTIENSDNHSIEEIGTKVRPDGAPRATYLKLSTLSDLRAIHLALRDWEILVRVGNPPGVEYTRLESVEVDGTGFLGSLKLTFSSELNVLVGGRGTGKSALLETLRYALDLPDYSPTEYRQNLIDHAWGSGGKVSVRVLHVMGNDIRQDYLVERASGESPRVYRLSGGASQPVYLPLVDILGEQELPLFFGQKEIYDVTKSPRLLRQLLDEIIGRTARQQLTEIRKNEAELKQNARHILERRQRLERREEIQKRLTSIEHEEQIYREQGILEKMQRATTLTRDEERLKHAQSTVSTLTGDWQNSRESIIHTLERICDDLAQAESEQKSLLAEVWQRLQTLLENFDRLFAQGQDALRDAQSALTEISTRWQSSRQPLDEEIRRIKQQFGEHALNPDRLLELTAERQRLRPELESLERIEREIEQLQDERQTLLERLREARQKAFRLRQEQARELTEQLQNRVRIQVEHRALHKEYTEALSEFFGGSRIQKDSLSQIAQSVPDGIELAQLAKQGKAALQEKTRLSEAYAERLLNFLNEKEERWFDLELLTAEDAVRIELRLGEKWQPLETLSAGQRATAMLLILLTQSNRPLLVDQPEDDLDNRFIFDDVVKMLREQKGKHQLIAATHNPNIPVLAHAELVLALEAENERMRMAQQGGMDNREVQNFVRRVMEGGEEAFRRRAEKYGM